MKRYFKRLLFPEREQGQEAGRSLVPAHPAAAFACIFAAAGVLAAVLMLALAGCTGGGERLTASVIQTTRAGDKSAEKAEIAFRKGSGTELYSIRLDPGRTYQEIAGFGGSFTESFAYVLGRLSEERRDEVLRAYFSPEGAWYSLARTHMASCDFSLSNYTYAPTPDDRDLDDFTVKEDMDDLIPLIRDAMAVEGAGFRLVASPWTAPPWMKDNGRWNWGSLLREHYDTWALYICRYIEEYGRLGIPVWGVTPVNEPLGNSGQWESMIFTPRQMTLFVRDCLGPAFEKRGIGSKILIFDQNRDEVERWAEAILGDPEAAGYVWGTAVHWYSSTIDWYPEALGAVHERFPDKRLMHTEGCIDSQVPVWGNDDWYWRAEATDWGYRWAREEDRHLHPKYVPVFRYARDMIGGLNSWLTGWIDWNIVLDDGGGPNHAGNWCVAPVLARPDSDEVYYTPIYHVMRHFSRYVRPGAVRIGVDSNVDGLMVTALRDPGGQIVVEVLNQQERAISYSLEIEGMYAKVDIPRFAVQTVIVQ